MKKLKQLLGLVLLLIAPILAFSQKTITGRVTDSKDNSPLAEATVSVAGKSVSVKTGADGSFSINMPEGSNKLRISYVGYADQTVTVSGESVTVSMVSSAQSLTDVVVIGYGTARKKDVTGALASIKAKDFNQGNMASPDQLLQGKISGLEITNNNGQPGAATTIKIRGNNSLRAGGNPLYVIDGVPLDGRTAKPSLSYAGSGLDFGPTPESNPLLYINPNDIAQVDVLKDASAAAIYGSRGANGVIVITTKKGSAGATKIEFGTKFAVATGYMKKYKVLSADEYRTFTKANNLSFDSSASVDALKEITQKKLTQEYNLAISGGNETGKFRASFFGSSLQGLIKKTSLDRYLGTFAGQYKFLDNKLSIDFNAIGGHTTEHMGLISNTAGAGGNLMSYTLNWNPTKSFTQKNGLWSLASNSTPNPLAVIDGYNDVADVNVFLANISASYKIMRNLEYKFLFAINHGTGKRNSSIDGWVDGIQGVTGTGLANISTAFLTSKTFTHTVNYNTELTQNLKFDALAGFEYWKTNFGNSSVFASQFNTNLDQAHRIYVLYTSFFQNAKNQFPLKTYVDPSSEIQSYFARVNFNMSDKYYFTATIRADGSSRFGKNNKYGYFPSVGVKWIASNEDFLKNNNIFSNLSLRASWGITGNQEFPSGASLEQFNSGAYSSIGQSNVANPDLKWEKTNQINIGVDYSILRNKIFGSIDYYKKNTTDLLFQSTAIQPAPASIFFINLPAHLMNEGYEFTVGGTIVTNKNFSWDANLNIAHNKNLLKDFNQANIQTALISGQGVSGALAQVIGNNQPVNVFYVKEFQGFDHNGQQIISDNPKFLGDPNPHWIYGFSNSLKYKKVSLNFNASGAGGFKVYNNTYNTVTNVSNIQNGKNISSQAIGSSENLNASVAASSRYIEDGTFIKLRNLTINYAMGSVGKYLKNLNVFVGGVNLFVITKFKGFDPEVDVDKTKDGYPSRNIEYIPYPTPRAIYFGFNASL